MTDKWTHKIAALLAKAESTTNEEEAATFTAAAQRLMLKYSIDEAMIDAQKHRPDATIEAEQFELHHTSAHAQRLIQFLIFPTVQGMGTCRLLVTKGQRKTFWLIGRRDDITANKLLIDSLIAQAFGQMKAWAVTDFRLKLMTTSEQRIAKGQFLISFGMTVSKRVRDMYQQVTAETTGSDLVLVNRRSVIDNYIAINLTVSNRPPSRIRGHAVGRDEGIVAGMRANLGRNVETSSRAALS